jgi:hypothetical protein
MARPRVRRLVSSVAPIPDHAHPAIAWSDASDSRARHSVDLMLEHESSELYA